MQLRFDLQELFSKHNNAPAINYVILSDVIYAFEPFMTYHNLTELLYIKNGNGKIKVEEEVFDLSKNDFLIINPNLNHGEFVEKGSSFQCYTVGLNNISFMQNQNENFAKPYKLSQNSSILNGIIRIFEEAKENLLDRDKTIVSLCDILIIDILRLYKTEAAPLRYASANDIINKVQKFIDENYMTDISVSYLSKMFFYNKNTMAHNFKRITGYSIMQYVHKKRIEDAKLILSITNTQISQIALWLGYCDPVYFSFYFKKVTGITPSEYRNQMKTTDNSNNITDLIDT